VNVTERKKDREREGGGEKEEETDSRYLKLFELDKNKI
jgi:hypothetical protein